MRGTFKSSELTLDLCSPAVITDDTEEGRDVTASITARFEPSLSVKDLIFQIEERQKLGRAKEARQAALLAQQEAQRRRRQRPAVQQAPQAPPSGSILSAPFPMLLGRETQQPTKVLIELIEAQLAK
ncbi:hypothetical protein AK812_SmicGene24873 [Symbiodinium microadriaticum]|uniref:Uncharacterized protein n=1 Tax=Symbiodinium microadriaticum TaxID=2951 RepID=A0A1Q9DDP0_SYMMI|nr:hypothetical protein AK812_SmicGene24873 [Symbiodinium microadriaticum]